MTMAFLVAVVAAAAVVVVVVSSGARSTRCHASVPVKPSGRFKMLSLTRHPSRVVSESIKPIGAKLTSPSVCWGTS